MTDIPPRNGDVWETNLDPTVGREQAGRRPAVIVSADDFNEIPNDLVVVVPITSQVRGIRLHVPIIPPEGNLTRPSVAMCDQMRTISVDRLLRRRGTLNASTLEAIADTLRVVLDL